ncbi:MAG: TIGR02996 domain-containing protein, partial [Deltaproteobacteria bacterium]|nr:TIGR02996 domain-containing protein [Deltaproteobacteria bacterium]
MDRVVAARRLIGDLVKAEQITVRRVEIVGRDLVKLVETLSRPPTGQELGEWLEEHPQVTELSASTAVLDELVDRHLRDPEAIATEARNPDLERQLRADAENVSPYLVYADWLQERADPLGELIALSVASANGNDNDVGRFERHLKRHEAYFLGESAHEIASRVKLQWRFGFVQAIDALGELDVTTWQRLLGLRVCELLESITLRRPCSAEVDAAIASAGPASMRALTLESIAGSLPSHLLRRPLRSLCVRASPSVFVVARDTFPPTLEQLVLHVFQVRSLEPLQLDVPDLEVLMMDANIAFLLETKFPRLERLTLDLVDTAAPAVHVLANINAPGLRHVALRAGNLDLETFRHLAALPLATRLRSLGLVGLGLTDDTIGPIAATRGFSSLEEVDVSHNELTRTGLETARALAPTVIS